MKAGLPLFGWQFTASVAFFLLGGVALGLPIWMLGPLEAIYLGLMYIAYLASSVIPSTFVFLNYRMHPLMVVAFAVPVFTAAWLFTPFLEQPLLRTVPYLALHKTLGLLEWHIPMSLVIAMGSLTAVLNLALVQAPRRRLRAWQILVSITVLTVLASLPFTRGPWIYRALEKPVTHILRSSLHRVQVNYFFGRIPEPEVNGGALALVGEKVLLLTGDGLFYSLDISADGERINLAPMGYRSPMNTVEFREQAHGLTHSQQVRFRAMDVLVIGTAGAEKKQLLVSHHYWKPDQACIVVRISSLTMTQQDFQTISTPARWQTLYETQPCLPVEVTDLDETFFIGHQTGGSMIQTGPQKILMALGELGFDGVKTRDILSQDMDSDYGKILEVDINNGTSRIFSTGHRNPQGLHQDGRGRIWSTEHGPQGGDELNLIQYGNNYGWPFRTLGTQYWWYYWPAPEDNEPERDYVEPAYAWTPSIGIAGLTSIHGGSFGRWQNQLLIGSLAARSLFRVRIDDDRPVETEPIPIYLRVRDVMQDSNGHIIFWADGGTVGLLKQAPE